MPKIAWKVALGITSLWFNWTLTASLTVAGEEKESGLVGTDVGADFVDQTPRISSDDECQTPPYSNNQSISRGGFELKFIPADDLGKAVKPAFTQNLLVQESGVRSRGTAPVPAQESGVGALPPCPPRSQESGVRREEFSSNAREHSSWGDLHQFLQAFHEAASMPTPEEEPLRPGMGVPPVLKMVQDPIVAQSTSTDSDLMEQVTSVSSLSDVQPTDWAYQALRELLERYGVLAGYPDGTFRGNRAMTRYEFASALNAALLRLNELIDSGTADNARREDLVTYERLQTEFATELATLRSRVGTLESRTETLDANQFSTTTKLTGLTSFNLAGATFAGEVKVERTDPDDPFSAAARDAEGQPIVTKVGKRPSITMSYATLLAFNTSFTGKDSLSTALAVSNGTGPTNLLTSAGRYNTFGVPVLNLTVAPDNQVILYQIVYEFPVNDNLRIAVAPRLLWLNYFDTNAFTSAYGRGALSFNSFGTPLLNDLRRGAGAVARWKLSQQLAIDVGYMADAAQASNPSEGLFGGAKAFTAQLTYSPSPNAHIRLLYDRANLTPADGQISTRPIKGVADDGFGGSLNDATANSVGINFDWLVTPSFGVFGRYTYSSTHLDPVNPERSDGNVNAQAFQFGLALPDLGKEGALGTLSFVVPFDLLTGRQFLVSGGGDGGTEYEFEASYFRPLSNNVAIVPSIYLIGNPNNFESNPKIYGGTLRMQFSF